MRRASTGGSDTQPPPIRSTPSSSSSGTAGRRARRPAVEGVDPGVQVDLVGRDPDPVLQLVGDRRGAARRPRPAAAGARPAADRRSRAGASVGHRTSTTSTAGDGTKEVLRDCFATVNRPRRIASPAEGDTVDRPRGGTRWLAAMRTSITWARSGCSRRCPARSSQRVARASDEVTVKAGHELGPPGRRRAGDVRARRRRGHRQAQRPQGQHIGPGAAVGELSLLDHGPAHRHGHVRHRLHRARARRPRVHRRCSTRCPASPTRCMARLAAWVRDLDSQVYG